VAGRSATGTKTNTSILETPQAINVVTQDQIRAQGANSVAEALRYTPGVNAERTGFDPRYNWITVRGFDVLNRTALDGMILPGGTYATPFIDPYTLERIEVLKGPASVLYGQNAPGGLVNFVSKRPTEVPFNEVLLQVGNYNRTQIAVDTSGPLTADKSLLYRFVGVGRKSDTQVDFNTDDHVVVAPSLTWRPTNDTTFTLLSHYQKDTPIISGPFYPAQGTLLANPNGQIPSSRNLGDPANDRFKREQFAVGYEFEHRFNDIFTVRQNLRYTDVDLDMSIVRGTGLQANLRTLNRSNVLVDENANAFTVDNQVQINAWTGPVSHTILTGLDYRYQRNDYRFGNSAAGVTPTLDIFNPVYGRTFPIPAFNTSTFSTLEQVGLYMQDQIKFDRLVVTAGGRYDIADTITTNRINNTTVRQEDFAGTARIGAAYLLDYGITPYANYSTSFAPTPGTDSAGAVLKPTTGEQVEAGIKYEPIANTLLTVSLFDLKQQNVVSTDRITAVRTQVGEIQVKGLEFEAKTSLNRNLDAIVSYAYMDAVVTQSTGTDLGKRPIYVPFNQASAWVNYKFTQPALAGFEIGGGARYIDSLYGDTVNALPIPSVTLYDFGIGYDFGYASRQLQGLKLRINANNVFDKEYVAYCTGVTACNYGPRRTLLATASYRW
jgi:iron complex outermembrane receptor protein